jgi:K+-transporting ATPase ATPase B chain
MDRVARFNVLAMSGRAVEASGDVDVILLDKTGTITYGNRLAASITAAPGVTEAEALTAALVASAHDETPEGRSVVDLARKRLAELKAPGGTDDDAGLHALTATIAEDIPFRPRPAPAASAWPTAARPQGRRRRDRARPRRRPAADHPGRDRPPRGRRRDAPRHPPDGRIIGLIELKDTVKEGLVERFAEFRKMGIRTVMVTGDNPRTAATIAREAGVDDFIAEAKPEDKIAFIRKEQADGHLVAMTGDGTNDAPALAQADVGWP